MDSSQELKDNSSKKNIILKVKDISKAFPGVQALDKVSVDIKEGEILAILGENGAGKSTLMKILSGLYQPDFGNILINRDWFSKEKGKGVLVDIELTDPRMAMMLGIGMVYQHFQLVGPFSVTENITIGQELTYKNTILLEMNTAEMKVEQLGKKFGLPIDPKAIVEDLPVGLKQRVEILKQLYRKAELLILDEPTSVLTPAEVKEFFKTIRNLRDAGKSIIFISHKLKEALDIADRIVVLRRGIIVGETYSDQISEKELAEMLVGRALVMKIKRDKTMSFDVVLDVDNLSYVDENTDQTLLENIKFQINRNQIVGVAGVQGNGQSILLDSLIGMRTPTAGTINFYDKDGEGLKLSELSTLEILRSGISYIPEDRTTQGLILDFNLIDNSWMAFHSSSEDYLSPLNSRERKPSLDENKYVALFKEYLSKLFLPITLMKNLASTIVNLYEVQASSIDSHLRSLSGGNQQKVLVGRELAKNPELIIAAQPTRGVDIGVMEKIHQELIERRNNGAGILLISSDLDEILRLADYIIVMYEGRIAGSGNIDDLSISEISEYMTIGKLSDEDLQQEEIQ